MKKILAIFFIFASILIAGCTTHIEKKADENNSYYNEPANNIIEQNKTKQPNPQENESCNYDSDCAPEPVCHPSNCVLKTGENKYPKGIICTLECRPGTLDCGQGECKCIAQKCAAVIN